MSTNRLRMSGPAAAAAISAASSIIGGALGRSVSTVHSRDASNTLAVRIGELARIILEALQRDSAVAADSIAPSIAAPSAAVAAGAPLA